jgi:hypothetical protein
MITRRIIAVMAVVILGVCSEAAAGTTFDFVGVTLKGGGSLTPRGR